MLIRNRADNAQQIHSRGTAITGRFEEFRSHSTYAFFEKGCSVTAAPQFCVMFRKGNKNARKEN
jgi:hypothetical protein